MPLDGWYFKENVKCIIKEVNCTEIDCVENPILLKRLLSREQNVLIQNLSGEGKYNERVMTSKSAVH